MSFPRKKSPFPIVLVRWNDAYCKDDTYTEKDFKHEAAPTVTVGFLVKEDKTGITVATDVQLPMEKEDEISFRGKNFVPKGMIHDITIIRK